MIVLMRMFQWRLANTTSSRVSTDVACRPMCCATESTTVAMVLTRNTRMLDAGVSFIDAHPIHPLLPPTTLRALYLLTIFYSRNCTTHTVSECRVRTA